MTMTLNEEEQNAKALFENLEQICIQHKTGIEKTELMTNSANAIRREIKVKGQKVRTVTRFRGHNRVLQPSSTGLQNASVATYKDIGVGRGGPAPSPPQIIWEGGPT